MLVLRDASLDFQNKRYGSRCGFCYVGSWEPTDFWRIVKGTLWKPCKRVARNNLLGTHRLKITTKNTPLQSLCKHGLFMNIKTWQSATLHPLELLNYIVPHWKALIYDYLEAEEQKQGSALRDFQAFLLFSFIHVDLSGLSFPPLYKGCVAAYRPYLFLSAR